MTEKKESQAELPSIMVRNQYIKDLSLEIPYAPEIFEEVNQGPETDIKINVEANHIKENLFNVELQMSIDADIKKKKLFVLELTYAGVVAINVPQEHLEPVLLIEIPRLLFPYVRSVVTNTLVSGGLPPLMLNPIDFVAMYNAREQAPEAKN
ncbi:MAG: protein-export chaperone SecB [Alphaproteobacteria bacterium]|nr:protein-export chaperone SecB [Alphaproteobacteria bacterium]